MKRAWILLLAACAEPADEIRQSVRAHLKIPQTPDEVIVILEEKPDSAIVRINTVANYPIFYLTRGPQAWKVEFDLKENFLKQIADPTFELEYLNRMGQRLSEKFNRAIKLKPGIPKIPNFDEADKVPRANLGALFNATPEPGRVVDFYYTEKYLFRDGTWVYDSYSIFDRVTNK